MKALQTLEQFYLYDLEMFCWPWLCYPLCIPLLFYVMFFLLKWWVLTIPVWLPLACVFSWGLGNRKS